MVAHQLQLSKPLLAGMLTLGAISSIIAIVSFVGCVFIYLLNPLSLTRLTCFRFVGALIKRAGGVRAFARTVAWLVGLQLVFSVIFIIAIYVEPKSDFIKQCENGSTDSNIVDTCTNKIQEVRGITTAIVAVALLLHCCTCRIPFIRPIYRILLTPFLKNCI